MSPDPTSKKITADEPVEPATATPATPTTSAKKKTKMTTKKVPALNCNLKRLIEEGDVSTCGELAEKLGVSRGAIENLVNGKAKSISFELAGAICEHFGVTMDALLEVPKNDLWATVRRVGRVVIHLASRSFERDPGEEQEKDSERTVDREYLGTWDVLAKNALIEHIRGLGNYIEIREEIHADQGGNGGVLDGDRLVSVCDGAVHFLVGSPAASYHTEEIVSAMYGVPPRTPGVNGSFPYDFVWGPHRDVRSSFAWETTDDLCGIIDPNTTDMVAERTFVGEEGGVGLDCGLIVTYRVSKARTPDGYGEGLVIGLLGLSGPGTMAAARVATRAIDAPKLYPDNTDSPAMRVVQAQYTRPEEKTRRDNRQLKTCKLVGS